jgi:hypothetical protein
LDQLKRENFAILQPSNQGGEGSNEEEQVLEEQIATAFGNSKRGTILALVEEFRSRVGDGAE